MPRRLGAYVLPGDPVWLEETLLQYYPLLGALIVPVPEGDIGWTGASIPVAECLEIVRRVDSRGIARYPRGTWVDRNRPMRQETAQRQFALDALRDETDWVLQLDSDEFLPRPDLIWELIDLAERENAHAVEIPMRVLFRRTRRHVFEVVESAGAAHHEYPGAVLVRPTVRLEEARRARGRFIRATARGAGESIQLRRPATDDEIRIPCLSDDDAIIHNSWARTPAEIRRKIGSWGHARDGRYGRYYWGRWWPAPVVWWAMRDFHPFSGGLWPRLRRVRNRGIVGDSPRVPAAGLRADGG